MKFVDALYLLLEILLSNAPPHYRMSSDWLIGKLGLTFCQEPFHSKVLEQAARVVFFRRKVANALSAGKS